LFFIQVEATSLEVIGCWMDMLGNTQAELKQAVVALWTLAGALWTLTAALWTLYYWTYQVEATFLDDTGCREDQLEITQAELHSILALRTLAIALWTLASALWTLLGALWTLAGASWTLPGALWTLAGAIWTLASAGNGRATAETPQGPPRLVDLPESSGETGQEAAARAIRNLQRTSEIGRPLLVYLKTSSVWWAF
jgi:hypothetical protein